MTSSACKEFIRFVNENAYSGEDRELKLMKAVTIAPSLERPQGCCSIPANIGIRRM
jgi:hypothetical protein